MSTLRVEQKSRNENLFCFPQPDETSFKIVEIKSKFSRRAKHSPIVAPIELPIERRISNWEELAKRHSTGSPYFEYHEYCTLSVGNRVCAFPLRHIKVALVAGTLVSLATPLDPRYSRRSLA